MKESNVDQLIAESIEDGFSESEAWDLIREAAKELSKRPGASAVSPEVAAAYVLEFPRVSQS